METPSTESWGWETKSHRSLGHQTGNGWCWDQAETQFWSNLLPMDMHFLPSSALSPSLGQRSRWLGAQLSGYLCDKEIEGHTHMIFPNQEAGAICHSRSNSEPASRPVIVHWNLGHPPWCRPPRAPTAQSGTLPLCFSCSWKPERTRFLACLPGVCISTLPHNQKMLHWKGYPSCLPNHRH